MGDPTGISGYVVGKLLDKVIDEITTTIRCTKICEALRERLERIRPLVLSAHSDLPGNRDRIVVAGLDPVKNWLEDLRNLLEEAEELVSKCSAKSLNVFKTNKISKQILDIKRKIEDVCTAEATLALFNIQVGTARGVEQILARLPSDLGKKVDVDLGEIDELVTRPSADHTSSSQQSAHTAEIRPVTGESFGVGDRLKKLRGLLLDETKQTEYVGLYGTGGIGKTRLAELAYNSKEIQDNFQRRFWLTVGRDASIKGLLLQLSEKLGVKTEHLELSDMKTELYNALRGMKVLLVLDDIWDNGQPILEMLNVTSGPDTGSTILVTTRNIQVLRKEVASDQTLKMEGLSPDDSWALFQKFAFKRNDTISNEFETLAKEVAAECKGLPLALKVVARALAGKQTSREWTKALKKLQAPELLDQSQEIQLYEKLQLSYDELKSVEDGDLLQKCFIYFASFPEDCKVSSKKLLSLLEGEKLLEAGDEVGHGFALLQELIDRSLIEGLSDQFSSAPRWCRVHDVLRDFALHLIREERAPMMCLFSPGKGLEKFPDEWLETTPHISNCTHLSLNNNRLRALPDELKLPKLEMLLLANNSSFSDRRSHSLVMPPGFLESFSSLKLLDLDGTWIDSLPETLGNLTNLTHLVLSDTMLNNLPAAICKLSKLEYLGLSRTRLTSLPNLFGLQGLRELSLDGCYQLRQLPIQFASKGAFPALEELILDGCLALEGFPATEVGAFPKLEILSITECLRLENWEGRFASGVFPALEELNFELCFALKNFPATEVGAFPKLEILSLRHCESIENWEGQFASGVFPALKELNLDRCLALKNFPATEVGAFPKLKILSLSQCESIEIWEGRFASGMFPALKELNLHHCLALKNFPATEVGAFPKLVILSLKHCKSVEKWEGRFASRVFPALKELKLDDCPVLKNFPATKVGAFPKLEILSLRGCQSIENWEGRFASGAFPALKTLSLEGCLALKNFPAAEVGAFPKLEILSITDCEDIEKCEGWFASGMFPALLVLTINGCRRFKEFPQIEKGVFPKLEKLSIRFCTQIKKIGDQFTSEVFPALKELDLTKCLALERFPAIEVGAFPKLEILLMPYCEDMTTIGDQFAAGMFPALKKLNLYRCRSLEIFPTIEVGTFPQLMILSMKDCELIMTIGDRFASGVFPALEELNLSNCLALENFPATEEGAFPKLKIFLMQHCQCIKTIGDRFASGVFPALEILDLEGC